MRRFQAIDIGTNSIRSTVVEVNEDSGFRIVDDEKETTRLGTSLLGSGELAQESIGRSVEALRAMQRIGEDLGVSEVRAIGTAAMRMAANGGAFRQLLIDELGLEVEIVSEEEEGRLVFLSAAANFELASRAAVIDIGGGSVEVVQSIGEVIEEIVSMPLGARVLSERFAFSDPMTDREFKAMKRHVRRSIREGVTCAGEPVGILVGSGGTVTSVAAMIAGAGGAQELSPHGMEILRTDVMLLLSAMSRMGANERRRVPGLSPDRVDIIVPGLVVLAETMRFFGVRSLCVNARGIREGIVIDSVRRTSASDRPLDRMENARRFGDRLHVDRKHAEQVTRLALGLFDALAPALAIDLTTRPLLEAAASLHDVGYYVSYDRHHKHGYHLIANAALPGFTLREMRIIAAIARYHTKALPKPRHEALAVLARKDRNTVEQLAAILRVADGLDRGRRSNVSTIDVATDETSVSILLHGDSDFGTEVYGAEKKRDLFERVFGLDVEILPANQAERTVSASGVI